MKKTFRYVLAGLTCVGLTFTACDNSSPGDPGPGSGQYENLPYSDLTPAQQKEKLANEANAFINQMKGLNDQKAIDVIKTLDDLLKISNEYPKVGGTVLSEAQDLYKINQFYGKFTWNASTKTWTEAPANELSFNFPVGNQTAKIAVTGVSSGKNYTYEEYYEDYVYLNGRWQWVEGVDKYTVELPKELSAKIMLGSQEVGHIKLNADVVSADAIPNSASYSFGFGSYALTQTADKNGNATATLKNSNTTLMSFSAKLNGNVEQLGQSDDYTGNFQLKLMNNLVLEGSMDYANYRKEVKELEKRCYPDIYPPGFDWEKADEDYTKGEVEISNKYADIYLVSTKDNTKIAKLISKAVKGTDPSWGYTFWESVAVLEFGDGSQVEAEVYFTSGFNTVLDNFKSFIGLFQ